MLPCVIFDSMTQGIVLLSILESVVYHFRLSSASFIILSSHHVLVAELFEHKEAMQNSSSFFGRVSKEQKRVNHNHQRASRKDI
jgi:hypothetical protein